MEICIKEEKSTKMYYLCMKIYINSNNESFKFKCLVRNNFYELIIFLFTLRLLVDYGRFHKNNYFCARFVCLFGFVKQD